jgi:hypothetical protein
MSDAENQFEGMLHPYTFQNNFRTLPLTREDLEKSIEYLTTPQETRPPIHFVSPKTYSHYLEVDKRGSLCDIDTCMMCFLRPADTIPNRVLEEFAERSERKRKEKPSAST